MTSYRPRTRAAAIAASIAAFFLLVVAGSSPLYAETGLNLSDRIIVDGFTDDYLPDETLFQVSPDGIREESTVDSQWGRFNDVNNIRITWDADFLYVAVEGFIFDNNTMIFFDTLPTPDGQNPGWTEFTEINSWRRAVSFDNDFYPDVFMATWDGNTTPQLWQYTGPKTTSQIGEGSFQTVATFSRDLPGRAMEAAIPWDRIFIGAGRREFSETYGDTVYTLPLLVDRIKVAAWVTTGADGLGGPDSAPDNLAGHQVDSAVQVVLDNYAVIVIDSLNVAGEPGRDGVPDFGRAVRTPTTPEMTQEEYEAVADAFFAIPPPIQGETLEFESLEMSPRAIAPELGDEAMFKFEIGPDITDPIIREKRTVKFTAEIYDMKGKKVRTIYRDQEFTVEELEADTPPDRNVIDGRDANGQLLGGGIYILRVVLEPALDQKKLGFSVVR